MASPKHRMDLSLGVQSPRACVDFQYLEKESHKQDASPSPEVLMKVCKLQADYSTTVQYWYLKCKYGILLEEHSWFSTEVQNQMQGKLPRWYTLKKLCWAHFSYHLSLVSTNLILNFTHIYHSLQGPDQNQSSRAGFRSMRLPRDTRFGGGKGKEFVTSYLLNSQSKYYKQFNFTYKALTAWLVLC